MEDKSGSSGGSVEAAETTKSYEMAGAVVAMGKSELALAPTLKQDLGI